jgi:glutaredoxin
LDKKVKIYGTKDCPYCDQLRKLLSLLRIQFEEVDIDEEKEQYQEIVQSIKHMYIPVIKINDKILSPNVDFKTIAEAANIVFKLLKV